MMQSNNMYNNHGPLHEASNSNSHSQSRYLSSPNNRIEPQHRRLSMTLPLEDGSCHDLSNLSLKVTQQLQQQKEQLFPSRAFALKRLPDIPDSHTLRLWEPLPRSDAPFHRSNTTMTCTLKDQERTTRRPSNNNNNNNNRRNSRNFRRSMTCDDDGTPGPLSPPVRPSSLVERLMSAEPPSPRPPAVVPSPRPPASSSSSAPVSVLSAPLPPVNNIPPPPAPTAYSPAPVMPVRPNNGEPGPRPKVNYKKLYGAGGDDDSKKDLRSSGRHMSFQEQQLQRTLMEEERRQKEQSKNSGGTEQQEDEPVSSSSNPFSQQSQRREPEIAAPVFQYQSVEEEKRPYQNPRRSPSPPAQPSYSSYDNNYCQPGAHTPAPPAAAPSYSSRPAAPRGCGGPPSSGGSSQTVMEIAPNLFVPYKGSHETWEAVQRGQFTVTTCFACTLQLVVIDTAEYLVCPDCHTVSPLSYGGGSASRGVERCGVGLGIKREWCDTEAALPNQQHQHGIDEPSPRPSQENHDMYHHHSAPPSMQPFPTTTSQPEKPQRQSRSSRPSYEQRHREKQAKYNDQQTHERSPSPEQEERNSYQQRRATFLI